VKILQFPSKSRSTRPDGPDFGLQTRVIHGYKRAFIHVGKGPALLLIHGIGDSSDTWRELIPQLARDFTVIAPDLLGHGTGARTSRARTIQWLVMRTRCATS
jgi:pimeloyl-ACP methyl ester carboxylesterase